MKARLVVLALVIALPREAEAQSVAAVPVGARVRVVLIDSEVPRKGHLVSVSPSELMLGHDSAGVRWNVPISRAGVRAVAVSEGPPDRVMGLLRWGLIGGIVGALTCALGCETGFFTPTRRDKAQAGAYLIGVPAALVGAISAPERWRDVPLSALP